MGQYYYLNLQNEQQGPVDASQLAAYGVNANTLVWTQGMAQWAPAGTVAELRPYIAPAPAPAAAPSAYAPQPAAQPAPQPQPQPAAQSAPQSVVYVQPAAGSASQPMMPKPGNNMLLGILSTLFCCLPLGVVSIIYASKVDGLYASGDYAGALSASKSARNWALFGAIGGLIYIIIIFIIYGGAIFSSMNGTFN